MNATECARDTAIIALAAAVMLAVPFSCLLVKGLVRSSDDIEGTTALAATRT